MIDRIHIKKTLNLTNECLATKEANTNYRNNARERGGGGRKRDILTTWYSILAPLREEFQKIFHLQIDITN